MRRIGWCMALAGSLALAVYGCYRPPEKPVSMAPPRVRASGPALWDYLREADYENTWKMWPGKSAFYKGRAPHGAFLTTYVNGIAYDAIESKTGVIPFGAIVVKENYTPDKKLAATTVMYKVEGYDPEAGNWFWAKYAPNGKVSAAGKVKMCINCHGMKKDNDYIMTAPLK
jgi:hypothetical protein